VMPDRLALVRLGVRMTRHYALCLVLAPNVLDQHRLGFAGAIGETADDDPYRPASLVSVRLDRSSPTAIQQDGDGLNPCAGWRIGLTHDGSKSAHGLTRIRPAQ
jgi:hypothetical protein